MNYKGRVLLIFLYKVRVIQFTNEPKTVFEKQNLHQQFRGNFSLYIPAEFNANRERESFVTLALKFFDFFQSHRTWKIFRYGHTEIGRIILVELRSGLYRPRRKTNYRCSK